MPELTTHRNPDEQVYDESTPTELNAGDEQFGNNHVTVMNEPEFKEEAELDAADLKVSERWFASDQPEIQEDEPELATPKMKASRRMRVRSSPESAAPNYDSNDGYLLCAAYRNL